MSETSRIDAHACLSKLRLITDVTMATVDAQGNPQARIIDIMLADEEAVYFVTARGKEFHRELMRQGRLVILGYSRFKEMIRFNAFPERLPDVDQRTWVDKVFEENPVMNNVYPGDARYVLEVFRAARGTVEYFNLGVHPIFRETFEIGGAQVTPKGFLITDDCIGCGICADVCPQGAVIKDEPYRIQPEHCLHCGLCKESCPSSAIVRL